MRVLLFAVCALFASGCVEAKLYSVSPTPPALVQAAYVEEVPTEGVSEYRFGCADVLEVVFDEEPRWDCFVSVGIDGRVPLGEAGSVLAEGQTANDVRQALAKNTGLDPSRIHVHLADPRAGRIYLAGPEANRHRVVPYRGPERIADFLYRVGAMKRGSTDLNDVYVIRPNVAIGAEPCVCHIDMAAIVLDGDDTTNVILQASDKVTVGETRRSRFSRLLPDWFRPIYRKFVGLLPPDGSPWTPTAPGTATLYAP